MIDWDRISGLRDEVGSDDFAEVIELFLEEVEEVILRLERSPEPSTFEADFHFLKGSALNLGFSAFSELCQAYESAASQGMFELIEVPVAVQSYRDSRAEFSDRAAEFGIAA